MAHPLMLLAMLALPMHFLSLAQHYFLNVALNWNNFTLPQNIVLCMILEGGWLWFVDLI